MDIKKALLIYPEFSPYSFWNYKEVCRLVGARYHAAALGMITLAALLPDTWKLKLVDMNTAELYDSDIDEADLVFIGGMLPQQANFIRLIDRIHGRGKKKSLQAVPIQPPSPRSTKNRTTSFWVRLRTPSLLS